MGRLLVPLVLAVALAGKAEAADSWGIDGEKPLMFQGKVVDILCTLSGQCPPGCGGGKRQLGLLRGDGTLLPAVKSSTLFAGAVLDLLPYCGKDVEVDGLLIEREEMRIYMVQRARTPGTEAWTEALAFSEKWAKDNGQPTAKEWFRKDPRVKAVIDKYGVTGIPAEGAKQ